jgi:hypothetical protein
MLKFVSFYDYADNAIIDESIEYIDNLPDVGDIVSWLDPSEGRCFSKVVDIRDAGEEKIFKMGRVQKAEGLDLTKAIPIGKTRLEHEFIIKKD